MPHDNIPLARRQLKIFLGTRQSKKWMPETSGRTRGPASGKPAKKAEKPPEKSETRK